MVSHIIIKVQSHACTRDEWREESLAFDEESYAPHPNKSATTRVIEVSGKLQAGQERQEQQLHAPPPTGINTETLDGRHREHRRHRANPIVLAEKCLHRWDPGDPASLDSEV